MRRLPWALAQLCKGALLMFVRHFPGDLGTHLRFRYYRKRLGALGRGTRIDEGVHIVGAQHVYIGANCWIAANAFLGAGPPSTRHRHVLRRPNPDFAAVEGELRIADDVYIAPQVLINAHGGVTIEDNVAISVGARLFSSSHHYRDAGGPPGVPAYPAGMRAGPEDPQVLLVSPIVIGSESFVGANAIVLPGVTIGPKTWLGAGGVAHERLQPGKVYSPRLELVDQPL